MVAPRNRTLLLGDADRTKPVPPLPARPSPDHVYCGDAVEGLRTSPPADLIFADPPYDEKLEWHEGWVDAAAENLRPGGSIYVCCDWRLSGPLQALLERRFTVRNRITWKREKGRTLRTPSHGSPAAPRFTWLAQDQVSGSLFISQ